MAKRFAIYIIAFAIPLLALLSHHELRRILKWGTLVLTFKTPSHAMELLPEPTEPLYRSIKEAEGSEGKEQWLAYEKLYRQTGEVWIGVFGLRYGMAFVRSGDGENKQQDAMELLRQAMELSERDKDNAFPLLAKACALFALKRDDEALKAFHEAAKRPNFRTYDEKHLQLTANRTFTVEERFSKFAAISFRHMSALREMARKVVAYSAEAEKEGDFEQALNLAEDAIKVGAKMKRDGLFVIEALVGIAIQSIAFAGETRKLSPEEQRVSTPEIGAKRLKLLAQKFSEFAEKHGRKDLAELALREAEESAKVLLLVRQDPFDNLLLLPVRKLTTTRLTSFALLLSSLALALIGLISAAFLWRIPIAIDSYSPITATLIVAGLPLAAVVWSMFGTLKGEFWDVMSDQTFFGAVFLPFAIVLLLFAVCFLPALWQLRGKVNWRAIAVLIGIPTFAGALTVGSVNTPVFRASSLLLTILLFLSLIALAVLTLWLKGKLDAHNPLARIFSAVAFAIMVCVLLFIGLWFGVVIESLRWQPHGIEEMPVFLIPALTVSAFVFFIAWGVWSRFGHHDYRHICQGALARLRGAAVLLLLICWWGYAIVEFSSLPIRAKLHQALDDIITHGELAFIQREIGSSPNKN
ncbi:MAG: tetratricopeptide repeat protein [Armatimonadota bacterium]